MEARQQNLQCHRCGTTGMFEYLPPLRGAEYIALISLSSGFTYRREHGVTCKCDAVVFDSKPPFTYAEYKTGS